MSEMRLKMPRKARCRCICGYPDYWTFVPEGATSDEVIVMSLDEFETIRLIDKEGLTQEECAARMGVSRTTVTGIYDSARRKLATSLIDGKKPVIGSTSATYAFSRICDWYSLSIAGA